MSLVVPPSYVRDCEELCQSRMELEQTINGRSTTSLERCVKICLSIKKIARATSVGDRLLTSTLR